MTIIESIDKLSQEIKSLEDKSSDLLVDAYNLRGEREKLTIQWILEYKLLTDTNWEIVYDGTASVILDYIPPDMAAHDPMDDIKKVIGSDYHCWFDLDDGIKLQFDKGAVSMTFKESKQVVPFAKKYKLNLNGKNITDRIDNLKRAIESLEDMCHVFNL